MSQVRESYKVLLIEDNGADAYLLRRGLAESEMGPFSVVRAENLKKGLGYLDAGGIEAVLLDLYLPDSSGLETFQTVYEGHPRVPVLVLSGLDDDELALEAVKAGAQDYLVKGVVGDHAVARALRYAVERRRLQAELDQVRDEQLRVKSSFLSHVSHELRTPLAATHQFLTIVLDGLAGAVSGEQEEYLGIALDNVEQLVNMIDDLLDASRAESGKLRVDQRRTSIEPLFDEVCKSFTTTAKHRGVTLSLQSAAELEDVLADPSRVRQVLTNLVDNALKFTGEGGRITLSAEVTSEEPGFLTVSVRDTGCGIEPEAMNSVFERLFQEQVSVDRSRNGLGLGLYICKELVARHQGRIWVESVLGEGATFRFTLPLYSVAAFLRPVLTPENLKPRAVTLIKVRVAAEDGRALGPADESALSEVFRTLSCSVRLRDAVLPRMAATPYEEVFLIVSCGDRVGASSLAGRLNEKLSRSKSFSFSGLAAHTTFTACASLTDLLPGDGEPPSAEQINNVYTVIEKLIHAETDQRSPCHESEKSTDRRRRPRFPTSSGSETAGLRVSSP